MPKSTRLLLYQRSAPLQGVAVRVAVDGPTILSDDQGAVNLSQLSTQFELQVACADGLWRSTPVVAPEGLAVVVNLPEDWPFARHDGTQAQLDLGPRYQFIEHLGEGGMGQVLRAYDQVLQRSVAIKLLHDDFARNHEAQTIFLKEARSLAHLSHPNLIAVHDIIEEAGRGMMVLELVEGQSLDLLIHAQALRRQNEDELGRVLAISMQLADVLAYLHDAGLIHRDIKPSNVMLRKDGAVKLIDFGLARRLSELGFKATRIRGTPAYMSPEQLQGSAITPASDVYQLGVTLFELFSGQLPFREDTAMYARLVQPAPRLSTVTKVPEELDELLLYCLAIQPEERPQNAGELLPILQRILAAHGAVPVPVVSSSHAALAAVGSSQALRHLSLGQGARTPMGLGNRISELGKRPEQSSKHNAKTLSRELAPAAALRPEPEPPAAVTPTHDFDALMDDAISAMLEKDYPEALRSLRAASALRPDDARVQANLARLEELGFS